MNSGIYKITNVINGMMYVGSAFHINRRWNFHKSALNLRRHKNKYLQNAWNKYSENAFEFSILELCEKDHLLFREQIWLNFYKCFDRTIGYNLTPTAGSNIGLKMPQTKEQIEARAKLLRGQKRSKETLLKMSLASLGKKRTKEQIEKAKNGRLNWKHSEKTKAKIGKGNANKEKWPHENSRCKCRDCADKRNEMKYNLRHLVAVSEFKIVEVSTNV